MTNDNSRNSLPLGDFIKQVEDGIDYYTEKVTGRSGMSHSGLARTVGVKQHAITYWVQKIMASDPINNDLPECFKPFAGKVFKLINASDPEGSEILSDEFCSATAIYYACFAKPKDITPEAKLALMICNGKGFRAHIQEKTGWKQLGTIESTQNGNGNGHVVVKSIFGTVQVPKTGQTQEHPIITDRLERDRILTCFPDSRSMIRFLNKISPLDFHHNGNSRRLYATSDALVDFFDITIDKLRNVRYRYSAEFELDGFKTLKGPDCQALAKVAGMVSQTPMLNAWTPQSVIRFGMVLEASAVAAQLRGKFAGRIAESGMIEVQATPKSQATLTAPKPVKALAPAPASKLEVLERIITLGDKLGGFDEQQKVVLRDRLINTL